MIPKCNQCDSAIINGVYCHEKGCPNINKYWDVDDEMWIDYPDEEDFWNDFEEDEDE